MTTSYRIESLTAAEFERYAAVAASIYGAAMNRSAEVVVQRREIITSHLGNPNLLAAIAVPESAEDGEPVGFGYGYRGAPGQWWHDVVAKGLGRERTREWLRDGFELAELHVRPEHQGHGLGSRLLADIMGRATTRTMLLSTPDAESPARCLYRSRGFTDLLRGFFFPGSAEAYAVMGCVLRDR